MPIPRTLNQDFFKVWSPEMAYVLGYLAADGCMIKNRRGGYFIEFTSTDRILIENLRRVVGSNHHISERIRRNPKWKTAYRLQVGSKAWFQDLSSLGFTARKSNDLVFPNVPTEYLGHFVRGYFDGDGCVYFNSLAFADRKNKRWILLLLFTSGSRGFLDSLKAILSEFGVKGGYVFEKSRGFDLRFSHKDSLAIYMMMYHTAPISDLYLPRKREKLERAIQVLGLDKELRL